MTAPVRPDSAEKLARILLGGGVALVPTDTVVGLAAHPAHPMAIARVFALKSRPAAKHLPVMISGRSQLPMLGIEVTPAIARLIDSPLMPGGLTLVAKTISPPRWATGRKELAFRLPDDGFLRQVLDLTGPLFVTSGNRHGALPPATTGEAAAQLSGPVDMQIAGRGAGKAPSTLLDCTTVPARILRRGATSREQLGQYVEIADE